MKKLFYIVLVIVILVIISKFIHKETPVISNEPTSVVIQENVTAEAEIPAIEDSTGAEAVLPDSATDADGQIVDEVTIDEDIVEANPEATADEDETIVAE